jgi:hypothetical protein
MLQTFQTEDNSTSDNCLEKLYTNNTLSAIVRFLKVRVPVYARVVGNALLVAGLEKNFETDLTINEIASNSGVSRSMTIQSLKLLVDLQIFHKEEQINKPCTYKFNSDGDWLQYSTPEPKKKVVRIFGEAGENENHSCSPQDTPQQEEPINALPLPLEPGDVEPFQQPHPDYANEEIFIAAAHAHAELSKPKPPIVIKFKDGDGYWEMACNTDLDSGNAVKQIVEKEGITVQRAVSQFVKLGTEVIKIFADLKIPFRITDSPAEAIKKLLGAIAAKPITIVEKPIIRDEVKHRRAEKLNTFESYYAVLKEMDLVGSGIEDGKTLMFRAAPNGRPQPFRESIADLIRDWPTPDIKFAQDFLPWKETANNYHNQKAYAI